MILSYVYTYTHPGLELRRSTYTQVFFRKYIVSRPSVSTGFSSTDSNSHGSRVVFSIRVWESQIWRADYVHCSRSFYVGDLSIRGFWWLRESWKPTPQILRGCS